MLRLLIVLAMILTWLPANLALAQQVQEVTPTVPAIAGPAAAPPPVVVPEPVLLPPAYEGQMLRLAEILGSLHYLRELCGAREGQFWRKEMELLIEKEQPGEVGKQKMVAHFNRGFRGFQETYRTCTASASEAANRYLRQGVRLAAEIPGRYGN